MIVENRPGAGAVIGTAYVAHSAPDGYTFLVGAASTITNSLLLKDLPYEDDDLVPVGMIAVAPSTIIVHPSVPANNMKEFIAWAKAQGGKGVTWATAGNGSTPEFVGEMIKEATGVSFTIVPYKSGGDGVNAVLANNVSATSEASIVVLPKIKAGLLKAIATTYTKRISAYPSIPTTAEQGYPTVQIGHWAGLYAPRGTPEPIIERMNAALQAALKTDEVRRQADPDRHRAGRRFGCGFRQFHQDRTAAAQRSRGQDEGHQRKVERQPFAKAWAISSARASLSAPSTRLTIASALAALTACVASFLNFCTMSASDAKLCFAAARRLDGLLQLGAVFQLHLDAHHVAVVRAARGDRRVFEHADLFRQLDAPLVVDDVVGELIDEHVAFEQQRGDAERKIQLRRGQALRRIGPADVLDRHLRAVHHDRRDIVRAERRLCLHHADGVERGVVAADAGIEFQRNAHRLPLPAELR